MKPASLFFISIFCAAIHGDEIRLSPRFQTVYILEMANAFDQHLASRLTAARVLWVVLNPASADAVMTESLDDAFLAWMQRTYAPAPGTATSDTSAATLPRAAGPGERRRGTIFLVDPRRRIVLWSACELPKNSSPAEADRTAAHFANELKLAFGKK
jgi:hypothetical protein